MSINSRFRPLMLAACLAIASPLAALADSPTPMSPGMDGPGRDRGMAECPMHGDGPGHGMMGGGMMHGGFMFDGDDGVPPPLRRLNLTDAQQDKIFSITHAQAPQARELRKAVGKAGRDLHDLMKDAKYDEAKAKKAADALGKAVADAVLLHARTHHQILDVLTPEQREQLARHAEHHDGEHGGWHHDDHGGGPPH
jgi:Spy/CpxP family protein refolding chaperone